MSEMPGDKLAGCAALLQLELEVRQAESKSELEFLIVNRTLSIIPAITIYLWRRFGKEAISIERISGVSDFDYNAPEVQSITQLLNTFAEDEKSEEIKQLTPDDIKRLEKSKDAKLPEIHGLWSPFPSYKNQPAAGLWLVRKEPWSAGEMAVTKRLSGTFAHASMAISYLNKSNTIFFRKGRLLRFLIGLLLNARFYSYQLNNLF